MVEIPTTFFFIIFFLFGAAIGSFLNVLIWRLPRKQKITGRSKCPKCKKQLTAYDLIPIISYKARRKQCHYCQEPISARYVVIESITAVLFLLSYFLVSPQAGLDWLWLFVVLFVVSVLIVIFMIDLEHYLILDKVVIPSTIIVLFMQLVLGVLQQGWQGDWYARLITSVIGMFAVMSPLYLLWLVSRGRWMGFGDVKLAGFIGAALGTAVGLVSLFMAFIIGSIAAIPLILMNKKQLTSKVPFGTFIAIAAIIGLFYGQRILDWYLGAIGL